MDTDIILSRLIMYMNFVNGLILWPNTCRSICPYVLVSTFSCFEFCLLGQNKNKTAKAVQILHVTT